MNLKEAFQAQNKISELMSYINRYLSDADYHRETSPQQGSGGAAG